MNCYSNARLDLSSTAILYNNFTLESCQCLMIQSTFFGFQYESTSNSCSIFANGSSPSDLRVKINVQVCFVNRTITPSTTTTIGTTLPSAPVAASASVTGNNYYKQEIISLSNSDILTSLLIKITVPKTLGVNTPYLFTNFWTSTVNTAINQTSDSIMYTYELITGKTIVAGQWSITAQYQLTGQDRPTSNDTYIIQIQSYQDISGHF